MQKSLQKPYLNFDMICPLDLEIIDIVIMTVDHFFSRHCRQPHHHHHQVRGKNGGDDVYCSTSKAAKICKLEKDITTLWGVLSDIQKTHHTMPSDKEEVDEEATPAAPAPPPPPLPHLSPPPPVTAAGETLSSLYYST